MSGEVTSMCGNTVKLKQNGDCVCCVQEFGVSCSNIAAERIQNNLAQLAQQETDTPQPNANGSSDQTHSKP